MLSSTFDIAAAERVALKDNQQTLEQDNRTVKASQPKEVWNQLCVG